MTATTVKISLKRTPQDYKWTKPPEWCPGCGHFGILQALLQVFAELDMDPTRTVLVSGIGCSSRLPHYVRTVSAHTIHGRAIPFAIGLKLANPSLEVMVVGGDGDLFAIGGNHILGAGRRNVDFTVLLMDNAVYGLTRGQAGPTLPLGMQPKALSKPNPHADLNPLLVALASGFTFIARAYSYDIKYTAKIIKEAVLHKGSAIVQIFSPCVTYNNIMTREWYEKRVYKLDNEPGWDPVVHDEKEDYEKRKRAIEKILDPDRFALGILYKNELVPTFEERYASMYDPNYPKIPPAIQPVEKDGRSVIDFYRLMADRLL